MMALIIVVIAIMLSALVVFGGVSYYSHDIGLRTEISGVTRAHYEMLNTGLSNYQMANNGVSPDTLDRLVGYLPNGVVPVFPKYGPSAQPFHWKIENGDLCFYRTSTDPIMIGVDRGVWTFIESMGRSQVVPIRVGTNCVTASQGSDTTISVSFDYAYLASRPNIAFVFGKN